MISNKDLLEENKISCLCFSPNFQYCAIALKSNNKILIYEVPQNNAWDIQKWILKKTLKQQSQMISSLDWSIKDKLLSGSHDRSLLIWQKKGEQYTKQLASISNKLSIVNAKWAPNGDKFAVGTSCKTVYICFFNDDQNFWSSLALKPKDKSIINSTISSIEFHKSGNLIAVGSTDFSVRVITCNLSNQNMSSKADRGTPYQGAYGNINTFGQVLLSVNLQGWINNISFAPQTNEIFVLPHYNSVGTFNIPQAKDQQPTQKSTNWKSLPLLDGFYLNDNIYAAGGFDKNVVIFQRSPTGFQIAKTLETSVLQKMTASDKKGGGLVSGMKVMWDKQGLNKIDERLTAQQSNTSTHKAPIHLVKYANLICSYDVNGGINFWEV